MVQVAGALALEAGCVAEMATGEGKTLTATLPATVAGWRGLGCHIITVNDYLARRDAEWMGRIYRFCGLTVAAVQQEMHPPQRRQAYHADITYVTNKEVTADFLRDRLALGRLFHLPETLIEKMSRGSVFGPDRVVQRGLHYAIVDEADSILIDEAVTPLIISAEAPNPEQVEAFLQAADLATRLEAGRHYRVNDRYREVELTSTGKGFLAEQSEPLGGVWHGSRRREELATHALTAKHFYLRDKQYTIMDGKIVIIDEFTGRLMPSREWRDGLHQAVEAKESVKVNPPKETCARISFQRFFRLYRKLAGMTGTAWEAWREFWQIYHLPVVVVPTNQPCVRKHLPDRVFATEQAKWRAVVEEIERAHRTGQPLLVGTRSVRASEHLSGLLTADGLEHQVLNAVRHAEEAQIVASAGQEGRITVATNMAGRGTDIKLGRGVTGVGGLRVIATERHEAGRIDRQLFGRCARQGDPGTAQAMVSLEDELVRRYSPHLSGLLRRRHGGTQSEVSSSVTRCLFNRAQRRAERLALRQRKGVLRTDDWLDEYLGFAGSE
jgi:preprotein translocase subunit SecA